MFSPHIAATTPLKVRTMDLNILTKVVPLPTPTLGHMDHLSIPLVVVSMLWNGPAMLYVCGILNLVWYQWTSHLESQTHPCGDFHHSPPLKERVISIATSRITRLSLTPLSAETGLVKMSFGNKLRATIRSSTQLALHTWEPTQPSIRMLIG